MQDLPNRHRNHEIENLSERFLKSTIPYSWVINQFHIDYGTDYNCEIVIDKKVTGMNFTIQLKGKEKELNVDFVKLNIKKRTLNRWNNRLEPTMVIAFIVDEEEAYWNWFNPTEFDLTQANDSYTVNIPKQNKLSELNWNYIAEEIKKIFSRKHFLYSMPEFTSNNEIAWKFYFDGNYSKALTLFYELIKSDSKNALLYEAIAVCEYIEFNYPKALLNINKALEIEKAENTLLNKASILTESGAIYKDFRKVDEAIKIYETILEKNLNSSELYYNLGSALTKKNEFEKSI